MSNNMRTLNQDLNLKASMMSLANVDDEVKYYTKYLNARKEIDLYVERKRGLLLGDIKEKENTLLALKKEKEKREQENKELSQKFNKLCLREAEISEEIKSNKEEIIKKFDAICQKRKEISKLFDNRANEAKMKEKEIENLMKELKIYMNILKLRIINLDELQSGANLLKGYFVNSNFNLKYIEINLNEEEALRMKKFREAFQNNFNDN